MQENGFPPQENTRKWEVWHVGNDDKIAMRKMKYVTNSFLTSFTPGFLSSVLPRAFHDSSSLGWCIILWEKLILQQTFTAFDGPFLMKSSKV